MIIPVFKSGNRSSVTNYRPISSLCVTSKVLEKLVYQRIIEFLHPQLSPHQFGFLRSRSCLHKLLIFLSNVVLAINNKSQLDVIFLDLKKAFDSVGHNELLVKLSMMGICGPLWNWFAGYLFNRVHRVSLASYSSSLLPVKSGVPQGSILGPLLFLVYVNDIFTAVSPFRLSLFADNTQYIRSVDCFSDCLSLQQDLDAISDWSKKENLSFNISKSGHMRFGSKFPNSSYTINDVTVPTVAQYKDVGVIISSNLSFTANLNRILSKAYNSLGMIKRAVPSNCSMALNRTLYLTLVRSQVTYCSQVWRPYHVQDTKALERLQRRATKYVLNNYQLDYKSRLISLNLLPLTLWMELQDILLFLE